MFEFILSIFKYLSHFRSVLLYASDSCVTACGHCYHYACLLKWLKIKRTCPTCRSYIKLGHCCVIYQSGANKGRKSSNKRPGSCYTLASGRPYSGWHQNGRQMSSRNNRSVYSPDIYSRQNSISVVDIRTESVANVHNVNSSPNDVTTRRQEVVISVQVDLLTGDSHSLRGTDGLSAQGGDGLSVQGGTDSETVHSHVTDSSFALPNAILDVDAPPELS